MSRFTGFKFSLLVSLLRFFCSFSLALFTDAKLRSRASISSLRALDTVSFVSLFFPPILLFLPSLALFENDEDIKSIFNEKFVRSIAAIRRVEYQAYLSVISSWEREYLLLNV